MKEIKKCIACGKKKPLNNFYKNSEICKECLAKRSEPMTIEKLFNGLKEIN